MAAQMPPNQEQTPPNPVESTTSEPRPTSNTSNEEPNSSVQEDFQQDSQPEEPVIDMKALIQLIRSRENPKLALEIAYRTVAAFPAAPPPTDDGSSAPSQEEEMQDVQAMLEEKYPRCARLLRTLRESPNTHNKTPVAVLHEYATRFHREVLYTELSNSTVGPFEVEAKLTSLNREHIYASSKDKGRAKKDAKQAAAAGVLEALLEHVPENVFLLPGKGAKQRQLGARPRNDGMRMYARGHYVNHPPWMPRPHMAYPGFQAPSPDLLGNPMLMRHPGVPMMGMHIPQSQMPYKQTSQGLTVDYSVVSQPLAVSAALASVSGPLGAPPAGMDPALLYAQQGFPTSAMMAQGSYGQHTADQQLLGALQQLQEQQDDQTLAALRMLSTQHQHS